MVIESGAQKSDREASRLVERSRALAHSAELGSVAFYILRAQYMSRLISQESDFTHNLLAVSCARWDRRQHRAL